MTFLGNNFVLGCSCFVPGWMYLALPWSVMVWVGSPWSALVFQTTIERFWTFKLLGRVSRNFRFLSFLRLDIFYLLHVFCQVFLLVCLQCDGQCGGHCSPPLTLLWLFVCPSKAQPPYSPDFLPGSPGLPKSHRGDLKCLVLAQWKSPSFTFVFVEIASQGDP